VSGRWDAGKDRKRAVNLTASSLPVILGVIARSSPSTSSGQASTPLRVVYPELDEGLRAGSGDEAISEMATASPRHDPAGQIASLRLQ
jgi:hypothetical protein